MAAAVLLVLGGAALVFAASPFFHVKTVEISGTSELGRGDILRLAGLRSDSNLITLSPEDVAARLERDPWIARASVQRRFPSTLVIAVDERQPVVAVRRSGSYWIVATDGVTLAEASRDPGLPSVRGARPAPVGGSEAAVTLAAAIAAAWPDVVLIEDPQIEIAPDGAVTVELRRHVIVEYGAPSDPVEKGQALAGVLAWAQQNEERLASIDLRVPGAPAAELAGGTTRKIAAPSIGSEEDGGSGDPNERERDHTNEKSPSPTV